MIGDERNKEYHLMRAALDYADIIRRVATCDRAQYACVITSIDLRVLSYGFNGVAKGLPNGCLRPDYDKPCDHCNGVGSVLSEIIGEEPCVQCGGGEAQIGNVVVSGCGCIHAEANAVLALRQSQYDGPLIAFITGEPCEACAMLLINAGTVMVVYRGKSHRKYGGTHLLDSVCIPHGKPTEMAEVLVTMTEKNRTMDEAIVRAGARVMMEDCGG
jgi:deoxycytidylate deaminase